MAKTMTNLNIKLGDLNSPAVLDLLQEHLDDMYRTSPPESVHALDVSGLKQPDIRFWGAFDNQNLLGCVALKTLSSEHGEIKSMRTSKSARGRGVGKALLQFVIESAQQDGLNRLSLETGTMDFFIPAHRLYQKFGFEFCGPFADYPSDPNSCFMTLNLGRATR